MNINREIRKWNKFRAFYGDWEKDQHIPEEERDHFREIFDQVQSFQGRVAVKSKAVGGICEVCGERHAEVMVHVNHDNRGVSWEEHNSWDNMKVVCRKCRIEVMKVRGDYNPNYRRN